MRASRPPLLLFTCAMVLVGQASAGKSPSISSLSPTSGAVGTSATVSGSNFGSSQGSSTLTFNGVAATPTSWKTNSIVATVPATATTGPVVVTVGGTHSNGVTFTVTPVISSLSPTSGAVGTTVAISGSGFGATQGSSTVTFNGQLAAPTSWNATTIGTSVPSGATTGPVIVKVNSVSSNAVNFTVPPTLQSIAVSSQASSVPVGFAEPFVATGTYSDQSTKDLTAVASWTSLNTTVATISSPGVAMGQSAGNTMITATYANASASAPLVVTSRSLVTIAITPSNDFIPQGGAQQLTAMGKYSDGSSQDITTTVTWSSSNPSVAMINASGLAAAGSSGSASIVALLNGLGGSSNVTVTAAGPPTITATAFPPANAAGWNNSNVTVTFACTPGSYTITTCPGPQTVSSEGTNQIVSGTGTDSVGNTATASVPLNIDKTPPSLVVASPTDGDVFTNAAMAATGTISDALSGVATLTCNQAPVTFNGGSFSCNVSLNPGLNLVVLRSTDVAGNAVLTKMHVTLNVPLPSPASLQITPANATLVAGETQQFTAADEQGHPRNDATWTISNTTIASITADSSPVLTALGVGQVTLTAAVAGVSAQTQVTILGIGQAPGTPRWSISPLSGSVGRATFQAVPASGSPDIYFVEDQSNGNAVLRAFTSDGRQMWQQSLGPAPLLGSLWMVWPDSFGGLLVWNNNELSDFDSQTGAPVWEVTVAFAMPGLVFPVIRPDGGIVSLRAIDSTSFSLDILDGNTGQRTASFPLPKSLTTSTLVQNDPGSASSQTTTTPGLPFNTGVPLVPGRITVGSDGTTYLEWPIWNNVGNETNTCTASPCGYTTYVTSSDITTTELLMVVSPEGSSISQQSLASDEVTSSASGQLTPTWSQVSYGCSGNYASPGQQIPDGDGGVLASWSEMPCTVTLPNPATPYSPVIVTHFSSNGPSSYQLPLLHGFQLVLGENGTAFATGFAPGYTVTNPTPPSAVSFDMNSGQAMWTYNSTGIPPGGLMGFIAATDDGGVAVADGPNIVQLDSQGSPTVVAPIIANLGDSWKGLWDGVSNGSLIQTSLPIVPDQASPWALPFGNPSGNGFAAVGCPCLLQTSDDTSSPQQAASSPAASSTSQAKLAAQVTTTQSPSTSGPANCPICSLVSPSCTPFVGSGPTYLILVGDAGLSSHNVGQLFNLAAQQQANDLNSAGNNVIACRVSGIVDFTNAMLGNLSGESLTGQITGELIYFGHSGPYLYVDPVTRKVVAQVSQLSVGQESGTDTNISAANVGYLCNATTTCGSRDTLSTNARLLLNGCRAGEPIFDSQAGFTTSIGQLISNTLKRYVYAYDVGLYFSQQDAIHDPWFTGTDFNGNPRNIPASLPMYMVPEGTPGHKPSAIIFAVAQF